MYDSDFPSENRRVGKALLSQHNLPCAGCSAHLSEYESTFWCEKCIKAKIKDAKITELAEIISEAESRRSVMNGAFFYWLKARMRKIKTKR